MRDYGRVFSRIWESADFRALSEDGRALVLYLLTCQHGTIAGVFRVPDGYACEDLQWSVDRVSAAFAELLAKGFANRCETTKWVWVFKFLEWNPPENPNQRKAALKVAHSVPSACGWKLDFMRVSGPFLGAENLAGENPSPTVPQPLPNQYQEQEQEQYQEQEQDSLPPNGGSSASPSVPSESGRYVPPDCPHDAIRDLYHETLPSLRRMEVWNDTRQGYLRSRWREVCADQKFTREQALDWWRNFFGVVRDSKFLTGRARPKPGEDKPFQADLEWLIKPNNFAKVVEGKYL